MMTAEGGLEGVARRRSPETERRGGDLSSSRETNLILLTPALIKAGMEADESFTFCLKMIPK